PSTSQRPSPRPAAELVSPFLPSTVTALGGGALEPQPPPPAAMHHAAIPVPAKRRSQERANLCATFAITGLPPRCRWYRHPWTCPLGTPSAPGRVARGSLRQRCFR